MRKIAKPNLKTLAYVSCYKCQWEAIENPYTVVFGQTNSHATEYAIYNEDGSKHEYHTEPLGAPSWRVMVSFKYDDLPDPIKQDVIERYKQLWKVNT